MQARYRRDYDGEFVVTKVTFTNGKMSRNQEWVPNPIENHHISGRAAVIGSRIFEDVFDHQRLQRHKGGLLGKKRMQTYGTNDIWTDMILDFYISTDKSQITKVIEQNYEQSSTVYSSASVCLTYPGRLYLIPNQPPMCSAAISVYLAAFDGHKEIYMIGYSNSANLGNSAAADQIAEIMRAYSETSFILVGPAADMPAAWRSNRNVSCMDARTFVSYCDV